MIEVGKPFPAESVFRDKVISAIDEHRGELTYAQVVGILDLVKHEIGIEAHGVLTEDCWSQ
jgi:hypothetical protein